MKAQLLLLLLCNSVFVYSQSVFTPSLMQKLESAQTGELIPVLILLDDQINFKKLKSDFKINNAPMASRAEQVYRALHAQRDAGQPRLINELINQDLVVGEVRSFWINNSIAFITTPENLIAIKELPGIKLIDWDNNKVGFVQPMKGNPVHPEKNPGAHEPGHDAINAPALWAMGYSGKARTLYSFDTGIWSEHPAIKNRFKLQFVPLNQAWYAYDLPFPGDKSSSHGTHTTGTVLGLDTLSADTIGVAPGAYFIATDPIVSNLNDLKPLSDFMPGYEWALNPDGNPNTFDDVPDVINNSWGYGPDLGEPPCPEFVIPVFLALEAAGIANVFSAGNEGPDPMTMSVPHNTNVGLVNSFTVGAVNGNTPSFPIASFSSRGPSLCGGTGSLLIKPEVVAPGINVRSSVGQDGYEFYQGTSMAAPHVCGSVLLLKEAFPEVSGEEILLALYYTASDLGETGEDNTYGKGMIDVLAAFDTLATMYTPLPPSPIGNDLAITAINANVQRYICESSVELEVSYINLGNSISENTWLTYGSIGGNPSGINLGALDAGANGTTNITVSGYNPGNVELYVKLSTPVDEDDYVNNQRMFRFNYRPQTDLPFLEDFETGLDAAVWYLDNDDFSKTWEIDSTGGIPWSEQSALMNLYDYSPRQSQKDGLISPLFELDLPIDLALSFDWAYQKRSSSAILQDTLQIYASLDCGESWPHLIWEAWGDSLTTQDTTHQNFYPEFSWEWKHKVFDLSQFNDQSTLMLKFQSVNRKGNNLFLDNIRVFEGSEPVGIRSIEAITFKTYPNPSSGEVWIESSGRIQEGDLFLYDLRGKKLLQSKFIGTKNRLDLSDFVAGIYLVKIRERGFESTLRVVKF